MSDLGFQFPCFQQQPIINKCHIQQRETDLERERERERERESKAVSYLSMRKMGRKRSRR
jgi:hypothetical protein